MTTRFRTRAYEEVAYQEMLEKEKKAEIEALKKEMIEKKKNYGKYVK
jgi:hypothetical protein